MPIVRVLVVTHLSLTGALLLVFACVVLCQRLVAAARPSAAATPLPALTADPYPDEPLALPLQEPAPRRDVPETAASVLQWTLDLRTPSTSGGLPAGAALQASS